VGRGIKQEKGNYLLESLEGWRSLTNTSVMPYELLVVVVVVVVENFTIATNKYVITSALLTHTSRNPEGANIIRYTACGGVYIVVSILYIYPSRMDISLEQVTVNAIT
jgi:hypothetical protein